METKQELERQILKLNADYNRQRQQLEHELFELYQLEREKQSHTMKREISFYIEIFEHLIQLEDSYCTKVNAQYSCKGCKFCTKNQICVKNWLIDEFSEFTRQAKRKLWKI